MSFKNTVGVVLAILLAYTLRDRIWPSSKEGKTVETKFGSVKGIISFSRDGKEFYEWLGIPYAKPPQGSLRYASPQAWDTKWDGVRDGSKYGNVCAQLTKGQILGQEDCLFLNIHVPKIADSRKLLPVMVWIHGGSFLSGSSNMYRPNYFMDEDVILVTINYRLGALGFLSTGDNVIRGNMGLKDQSMAIRWVNENIGKFGGDSKKITIFGESAGSGCVHHQVLSPMTNGLIWRAISQSGSAANMWAVNEEPLKQAKNYARKVNCPTTSSLEMLNCLRNVDLNTLLEVHRNFAVPGNIKETLFVPVVESVIDADTFLPDLPMNLINSGNYSKVPWLAGFTKDEGLIYAAGILNNVGGFRTKLEDDWDSFADLALLLSETEKLDKDKIIQFYFEKSWKEVDLLKQFPSLTQLLTDRWFAYGMRKAAVGMSKHSPVQFFYYNKLGPSLFDILVLVKGNYPAMLEYFYGKAMNWFTSVILQQPPLKYGVCHGDDLAMLFHEGLFIFNVPKDSEHYGFSKDFVKAWVSFASSDNVQDTEFRGVKFPLVNPGEVIKVIEIKDEPIVRELPNNKQMDFWELIDK